MGLSDIENGWYQQWFELRDVEVSGTVDLLELSEKYGWMNRELPIFLRGEEAAEEYESVSELRYSPLRRSLRGKASVTTYDSMYLGVPADGKPNPGKNKLNTIPIHIRAVEADSKELPKLVRAGHFGYIQDDPELLRANSGPYAQFYVKGETLAELEKLLSQPGTAVELGIAIKGPHWLDPLGNTDSYLAVEDEKQAAELLAIRVSRRVEGQPEDFDPERGVAILPVDVRLAQMESIIRSVRLAVWVIAAATAATALFFLL
jgi:hypothetical protein